MDFIQRRVYKYCNEKYTLMRILLKREIKRLIDYYLMSEKGSAIDLSEYIIRVYTDDYRYRLAFEPKQTYGDLLQVLSLKIGIPPAQLQVFSQNGRRLNIRPQRMLKEVVYLRHGSILKVELPKNNKLLSPPQSNIYIRNYNQPHQTSKIKTPCKHPPNMKCISCLPNEKTNSYHSGNGLMTTAPMQKEEEIVHCDHGPNAKCLKCIDKKQEKVEKKVEKVPSIVNTPRKVSPQGKAQCTHSPNLKCHQCINSIKKSKSAGMLKTQSSISSPKSPKSPLISREKLPENPPEPQKKPKCLHGQTGKCLNCTETQKEKEKSPQKQRCNHGPNSKCINCIATTSQAKAAHIAFDEYLKRRSDNCQNTHSKQAECPNCQSPRNLKLQLNTKCDQHEPYPKGLCNRCIPENVTLKRQEYRHVDYVQFMNNSQMHNFINYWVQEKKMNQMRIAFLYGYYAEDPYYKNGIRAIVEALYEPEQQCTANRFQLKDSPRKTENLQLIIESLGLEKIGIVLASPNEDAYFTEQQIRTIADFQQNNSVSHSTGYKISNFFTVLVRPNKKDIKLIEPEVFMVSDQGQAMQAACLFDSNQTSPKKMKIKASQDEILPTVYESGKAVNEFDLEFLLVNIASGASNSNKFAILKNNEFPTMSRGRMKKVVFRDYLKANAKKKPLIKYGDINLLLLIADLTNIETATGIALKVSGEEQIEPSVTQMIDKKLEALL